MADCNETLRELERFLDEELDSEHREDILSHVHQCTDCHQAFDFHAELRVVIRQKLMNDEMPGDLLARIELCLGEDLDGDGQIG